MPVGWEGNWERLLETKGKSEVESRFVKFCEQIKLPETSAFVGIRAFPNQYKMFGERDVIDLVGGCSWGFVDFYSRM